MSCSATWRHNDDVLSASSNIVNCESSFRAAELIRKLMCLWLRRCRRGTRALDALVCRVIKVIGLPPVCISCATPKNEVWGVVDFSATVCLNMFKHTCNSHKYKQYRRWMYGQHLKHLPETWRWVRYTRRSLPVVLKLGLIETLEGRLIGLRGPTEPLPRRVRHTRLNMSICYDTPT